MRDITRVSDSLGFGEKATSPGQNHEKNRRMEPNVLARIVPEAKLATVAIHDLEDRWVAPQLTNRWGNLLGKAEFGIDGGSSS